MPLPKAEQLVDVLLARQQQRLILEKHTRLPYGWAIWLRSLKPLPRLFHARDVIAVLLPRPLPGRSGQLPALSPWNAARRLFWQDWEPAPRDQRWMRWTSAVLSAVLHLLFFLLLLWVAVIRTTEPDADGAEGERVQIEFIGAGAQEGGGDQAGAEAAAAAAPAGSSAASGAPGGAATAPQPQPQPVPPAPATPAAPAQTSAPPVAEPAPAVETAPPPSPVQATEVAEVTSDFVVPPVTVPRTEVSVVPRSVTPSVTERSVPLLQAPATPAPVAPTQVVVQTPAPRDIQVREREVAVVDVPVLAPQPMRSAEVPMSMPQREVQVREREVQAVVDPQVRMATVAGREPTVRAPQGRDVQVRERAIAPAPAAAPSSATGSGAAQAAAASAQSAASTAAIAAATAAAKPAQSGARPAPTPGNWATPARGDDWGASSRNRDGASQGSSQASRSGQGEGLFNADGSVRVPGQDGAGAAERGAPGGANDGWSKERIAQSGTWLKRPPYDYTPTSFDKYWVPQESLLAEWVRKGIKAMEIPLPGTSTKISCVISILQAGGGCGLSDPNMQDQPAIARPPPDIPFKKELQEDNGSR